MAVTQQQRQSQLFYAQDWRVIYQAFTEVNFAAYDFDTIRAAMVDYIRLTYPEDFNDWIESSEFVAIIDLLAYLGQSLAFRMDLNTRENFIETATRRESIIRLARMLSYNAPRAMPSQGLLKITTVITNQDLYDATGQNLKNVPITWNDQNNADWLEQFILVVNSSLNSNNYFGNPVKSGIVNGIPTELYEMNTDNNGSTVFPYTSSVAGNNMDFELVNPDFTIADSTSIATATSGVFYERAPNPQNSWYIIYRSDGLGNTSANTGFFLMFKQGQQAFTDYQLDYPVANRVLDVNVNGINNIDVWVQNVDSQGNVLKDWTAVSSVNGFNVIYNSLNKDVRDIYSVYTRDNQGQDQISIRFADGNFGNVPTGFIRVTYRQSNGLAYQIRPVDMQNINFAFNYSDNLNNTFNLVMSASLQTTVANSQLRASNQQIQLAASQNYYTQDRMVTGEDYNVFPLTNTQALKVKAVNRTYSGQSRFLNINDPTGTYQNIKLVSTDGILYDDTGSNRIEVSVANNQNSLALVANYLQPMLTGSQGQQRIAQEVRDFYYYYYPRANLQSQGTTTWTTATSSSQISTGALYQGNVAQAVGSNVAISSVFHIVTPGALFNVDNTWYEVTAVNQQGQGTNNGLLSTGQGAISITPPLVANSLGYQPGDIIASWNPLFNTQETQDITNALDRKNNFGLRYDYLNAAWKVITSGNINPGAWSLAYSGDTTNTNRDSSWLLLASFTGSTWTFTARAQRYIFESVRDVRFLYNTQYKTVDINTGEVKQDSITILDINSAPQDPAVTTPAPALGTDYLWRILGQDIYPDGYVDNTKVYVSSENNPLGLPLDPNQYNTIVDPQDIAQRMIFWTLIPNSDGYEYWQPRVIPTSRIYTYANQVPADNDPAWVQGEIAYVITTEKFYRWVRKGSSGEKQDVTSRWKMKIGRRDLKWIYNHYAPNEQRIDPAIMNIVDIYVLTNTYDTDLRNWIATNAPASAQPQPPTSEQLRSVLVGLEAFKTMTDQIIWHPVRYKVIFGSQAPQELQVRFKVIKASGTTVTDNEVKSLVIGSVNEYFSLINWDFGQSFFFTELAAYIHIRLAPVIASVVITPLNTQAQFGDLFEIKCQPDEIFISSARVTDVDIVQDFTNATLGITHG